MSAMDTIVAASLKDAGKFSGLLSGAGAFAAGFVPGLGSLSALLTLVTSKWTWRVVGAAGVGVLLLVAHHRGYAASEAKWDKLNAERQAVADAKAKSDEATVAAAVAAVTDAKAKSDEEIAELRKLAARVPKTKSCPPVLLDAIRGIGR